MAYCGLCGRQFETADTGDLIWCECAPGPSNAVARRPERHREAAR